MHSDAMRNKMDVKMYCAKHPKTQLTFSPNSKIGANSAYEVNVEILIHPCRECQSELDQIKRAIKIFSEVANEK